MAPLDPKNARRVAGVELNALGLAGVLPLDRLGGAEVSAEATPVHDIDGEVLFYRLPVVRGRERLGAVDIAVQPALGEPLLAWADGLAWDPDALVGQAREQAYRRRHKVEQSDEARFVAFSYPKLAVQFLRDGEEVVMLELFTWAPVPPAEPGDRKPLEPANFERWSLLKELPPRTRKARSTLYDKRLAAIDKLEYRLTAHLLDPDAWREILVYKLVDTRQLRYSLRSSYHTPCYELRGQETNVWCVGASSQMLLDFYRYEYTPDRRAQARGVGRTAPPNGLPYSQVGHVVTALESLTSNGLDVTMVTNPGFATFRTEIRANRPLISFVPGHSRTVAGYTETLLPILASGPSRGLLVYDPWPPNAGVITKWENFATQTYQYAYTAKVGTI
ncbi:MAG: hypothetical protein AAGC63_01895 [Propionicimonas sp.]